MGKDDRNPFMGTDEEIPLWEQMKKPLYGI